MNRVFGVFGLRLGVARVSHDDEFRPALAPESAQEGPPAPDSKRLTVWLILTGTRRQKVFADP